MSFENISTQLILFLILYGITAAVPFMAAVYLLLRRGNAIAPGVRPPVRLRYWTASFFAVASLAHVWWLLFYSYSGDLNSVAYQVIVMFDCTLMYTSFAGMLLAMLQDRRRPVWPALLAMIPFLLLMVTHIIFILIYNIFKSTTLYSKWRKNITIIWINLCFCHKINKSNT